MEISFKQDINHNYMILKKMYPLKTPFAEKMLSHNDIKGLLKLSVQHLNGETYYYYDIRSRQPLDTLYEGRTIGYTELRTLLSHLVNVCRNMEKYLLKGADILVKPKCIFWDLKENAPVFCCYPENEDDPAKEYLEFAEFMIDHVDQNDDKAAHLAYDYFNRVSDGIFSPEMLLGEPEESASEDDETTSDDNETGFEGWDFEDEPAESYDRTVRDTRNMDFYEEEGKNADKANDNKKFLISCAAVLMIGIGIYSVILLYPSILSLAGLSYELAPTIGGGVIVVTGIVIAVLYYMNKRGKKTEAAAGGRGETDIFHKEGAHLFKNDSAFYNPDTLDEEIHPQKEPAYNMEQLEYEAGKRVNSRREESSQTMLLTDYLQDEGSSETKKKRIKCSVARLEGEVDGEKLSFSVEKSPFIIGKLEGRADAVIENKRVSRIHACIRQEAGRYFLSDLNSTNGTCLNDRLLQQREQAALEDGDIIKIANLQLTFSI
ncbi:MAG: FHA domain-containing protein [Lachnospiraceae bacterium]|nr:FHA domain-containing protein [Lachnospiraceae bacterium]